MKKITLINILLSVALVMYAQQRPHYTQYILNNYILNPALSGIENYTDIKMSARDQWVGLNGAPRTCYLTIHGPIGKKDYRTTPTSLTVPGENPRGKSYWENYTAPDPHHGIGLSIINDKTGLYNYFTASVSYAYHLGISSTTSIAAGFSGGVVNISYDQSKATPVDPNDPALGILNVQKTGANINAGIWVYSPNFFLGVSVQQINPQKVDFSNQANGFKLVPHYFFTTGYRFLLNDDINAIPSVMAKYVSGDFIGVQFDLNLKLQYHDLFWLGASYRTEDGYAAMAGLNISNHFNFGYSYDLTKTDLNTVSRGTHEIILGFVIGNHYSEKCPANVW